MLVETNINKFFCAIGATLNVWHGEDVLRLQRNIGYFTFFLPTCYP